MPDLTMSIPHRLSRDEAQRRLRSELRQFQQQFAGTVQTVEERWDRYTLHLTVAAVGQTITGEARVEEQTIQVRVALPWLLAMLAGGVRQGIEQHARTLLLPPPKP